ncbi:SIMPL domain-containing protein [Cellulomonas palmilytica]|uniref:SIMPL domain-containing protein n=1 Tax=Cellulomonas palmilytica TaxID=2608402 RepID=UPI001F3DAD58|nr:SIMPL domain-containing protein [Cellulomonas palmilytica]UJP40968.1 SIMPL domain-containing protein [Cellulomonas palmilytica]
MQDTVVTVEGRFEHRHAAERGTVSLDVGFACDVRDDAVRRTTHAHARLVDQVRSMYDEAAGPVTRWASQRLAVWAQRPWNDQGVQLPLVHHASVALDATFSDLARLAAWVEQVAVLDGVTVLGVQWSLTDATRTRLLEDARERAVADADARARTYARALGLRDVRPVAVAEPGMLGDPGPGSPGEEAPMLAAARGMVADSADARLDLKPEELTVAVRVHARFRAS